MGRRKGDHSREEIARQSERASLQTDKTLNDPDKSEKLRRNMEFAVELHDLPPVDPDDPEQIEDRLQWYLHESIKRGIVPTVAGASNALGVDRQTMRKWETGYRREGQVHGVIVKRFRETSTQIIINGMLDGSVQPIPGIFVTSNDADYEQKATHTVQVEPGVSSGMSQDQLAKRYSADVIDTTAEPHSEPVLLPQSAESRKDDKVSIPSQKEPEKG